MPNGIPDISALLMAEGRGLIVDFARTAPTTATITWTIPTSPKVYNGVLITCSPVEINPSNYPTDGVVYTSSADLTAPANKIGNAHVVGAFYNDLTTATLSLTGLVANEAYFVAAHLISNVNTYHTVGTRAYPGAMTNPALAGDIPRSYSPPASPTAGQVYYDEVQKLVFVWDAVNTTWQATSPSNPVSGLYDPVAPFAGLPAGFPKFGDFFYNTRERMLKVWDGAGWQDAQAEAGLPTYQKPDVGDNLISTARTEMINVLKHQFGYPTVCVELNEEHYHISINNAIEQLRQRVDSVYYKQYFFVQIKPAQDTYYLNDPAMGTNRIVDVLRIHRLNMMGLVNFAPDNIYAQQFLNQFYAPGVAYDLVSIHLIHSMSEIYSQLFAGEVAFNWREATREMKIYKRFGSFEKVLIECSCEKTEQEILTDRWTQQWIQSWAEAEAMLILAHIRGKFSSLPGPGGGLQLNADSLINQAQQLQTECLRQIMDMEVGQNGPDNFYLPFFVG